MVTLQRQFEILEMVDRKGLNYSTLFYETKKIKIDGEESIGPTPTIEISKYDSLTIPEKIWLLDYFKKLIIYNPEIIATELLIPNGDNSYIHKNIESSFNSNITPKKKKRKRKGK